MFIQFYHQVRMLNYSRFCIKKLSPTNYETWKNLELWLGILQMLQMRNTFKTTFFQITQWYNESWKWMLKYNIFKEGCVIWLLFWRHYLCFLDFFLRNFLLTLPRCGVYTLNPRTTTLHRCYLPLTVAHQSTLTIPPSSKVNILWGSTFLTFCEKV